MKKLFLISFTLLSLGAMGQAVKGTAVQQTANGTYKAISSKAPADKGTDTGKVFEDAKGNRYPIMVSAKGRFYIIRTSAKTGNKYKQYIDLERGSKTLPL